MVTNEQAPYGAASARVSAERMRALRNRCIDRDWTFTSSNRDELTSIIDELISLRSLGSCADTAPAEKGEAIEHVAWLRYKFYDGGRVSLRLCDSDSPGAFKVYRSPPPVEARAVGMTESEREALKQAAEFIQPGFMPNNLPTGRCYEIAATLRALSTRLASGGEEDARLKDARKTIEEAYAFASPSYEAAANVDALECVSAKLEAWLNANPLAALPADKGE